MTHQEHINELIAQAQNDFGAAQALCKAGYYAHALMHAAKKEFRLKKPFFSVLTQKVLQTEIQILTSHSLHILSAIILLIIQNKQR